MKRYLSKLTKKIGLPPGTSIHIGAEQAYAIEISQVSYSETGIKQSEIKNVEDITIQQDSKSINWIDVRGINNTEIINQVGKRFDLHPLIIEDITNTIQLPKIEEHEHSFFLIIKAISFDDSTISMEHICLYFRPQLILSFQEKPTDTFKIVRDRILDKKGKILDKRADYLLYALFDYVIDTYFESLRKIDNRISELNDEVDQNPSQDTLKKIQMLKKQILILKRHFWYLRDIVLVLKRSESTLIAEKTDKYLTDLNDHIAHIIDISESFREELIDLSERHLSAINLRSNDIMKMLTIVAAIFMPLTFLAGIYGMNFKHMPELEWPLAYPILIGLMIFLSMGLLLIFKRKNWLS
jgi:magnesium transporter